MDRPQRKAFAVGTSLPPMSPLGEALFTQGVERMYGQTEEIRCTKGVHYGRIEKRGWYSYCAL